MLYPGESARLQVPDGSPRRDWAEGVPSTGGCARLTWPVAVPVKAQACQVLCGGKRDRAHTSGTTPIPTFADTSEYRQLGRPPRPFQELPQCSLEPRGATFQSTTKRKPKTGRRENQVEPWSFWCMFSLRWRMVQCVGSKSPFALWSKTTEAKTSCTFCPPLSMSEGLSWGGGGICHFKRNLLFPTVSA